MDIIVSMKLRAVCIAWDDPSYLKASTRSQLASSIRNILKMFEESFEFLTHGTTAPYSVVGATKLHTEATFSNVPWADPPLTSKSRILLFECTDSYLLEHTSRKLNAEMDDDLEYIEIVPLAIRERIYTSPSISAIAYDNAIERQPMSFHSEVLLWPCMRTDSWWELSSMQRQALFLPRLDKFGTVLSPGHIEVSAPLVPLVHRRLYHQLLLSRSLGFMLGWFETSTSHLLRLKEVVSQLQNTSLCPDHLYYKSGPLWWGRLNEVSTLLSELEYNQTSIEGTTPA